MKITKYIVLGLLALNLFACTSGSQPTPTTSPTPTPTTTSSPTPIPTPTNNSITVVIDNGFNNKAWNRVFATITFCVPGTSNCQTIDHILVDSGSTGFRINSSNLTLTGLPSIDFESSPLYQCMQYAAGYVFGGVFAADVKMGDRTASNIPIQIINDGSQTNVPTACSNGVSFASLGDSGAKGIIGVNVISNPNNSYTNGGVYICNHTPCTRIPDPAVTIPTELNINPVVAFESDNNGLIFDLPAVSSLTATTPVYGTLIFGLNTESNNIVPDTVNTVLGDPDNGDGVFISTAESNIANGLIDSGTPTLYFYSSTMDQCSTSGGLAGFYCPASGQSPWPSTLSDYNSLSGGTLVDEAIANYSSEIAEFENSFIVPELGEVSSSPSNLTIYGFPFFLGQRIYLGFQGSGTGQETPLGMGPAWGW